MSVAIAKKCAPSNDNAVARVVDLDMWNLRRLRSLTPEANEAAIVTFRLWKRVRNGERPAL